MPRFYPDTDIKPEPARSTDTEAMLAFLEAEAVSRQELVEIQQTLREAQAYLSQQFDPTDPEDRALLRITRSLQRRLGTLAP